MDLKIKSKNAVVAGHICLDITPGFRGDQKKDIRDILIPGRLTSVAGVKISTGGAVPNTGGALARLGVDTVLMAKIGEDYFGEVVQRVLSENAATPAMNIVKDARTSYTVILVPPGTDRIFLHDPGANDTFRSEDIDYERVSGAALFHFGYPPLMRSMYEDGCRELTGIFKKVKELGVVTSLDMSFPDISGEAGSVDWDKALKEVLPYVDIFVPSLEEILFMVMKEEFFRLNRMAGEGTLADRVDLNILQELGAKLTGYGAKIVLIKCGCRGCYVRTQDNGVLHALCGRLPIDFGNWSDRELLEESFRVQNVVSTTGAGDTTIAGFLAACMNGRQIEEAIRIACAVGAQCVQAYDALSGIGTFEEAAAMMEQGAEKNRLDIGGDYWGYHTGRQVWAGRHDPLRASAGE